MYVSSLADTSAGGLSSRYPLFDPLQMLEAAALVACTQYQYEVPGMAEESAKGGVGADPMTAAVFVAALALRHTRYPAAPAHAFVSHVTSPRSVDVPSPALTLAGGSRPAR